MAKVSKEEAKNLILDMLEDICGDDIVRENLDINLLKEDLIDSLDYVTLLMDVEDQIGVVLAPSELKREEMDTPNKIMASFSPECSCLTARRPLRAAAGPAAYSITKPSGETIDYEETESVSDRVRVIPCVCRGTACFLSVKRHENQ